MTSQDYDNIDDDNDDDDHDDDNDDYEDEDDVDFFGFIYTLISGIGFSLVLSPSYSLLAQWFDAYYPLVSSVFYSCGSVGLMVFAPLTQFLLTTYGWRNTFLLLGAIYFHIVVCAAFFRSPRLISDKKSSLPSNDPHLACNSSFVKESCNNNRLINETGQDKHRLTKLLERSGLSLLKNWTFIAISILMGSIAATFSAWVVYFIPHCLAKGLSLYEASLIATGSGFAHFIGHLIYLPFMSKNVNVGTVKVVIYISGTVAALALFLDRFTKTIATIFLSNVIYACGIGAAWPLCDVLLKFYVEPDMFAKAFGWRLGISGVLRYLPGFLVGKHRQHDIVRTQTSAN